MQKLEEQELTEVAGGAGKKYVTVTVRILFSGVAAQHVNEYGAIQVSLTDPEGTAGATLTAANGWSTKFKVLKGVEFYCHMDLRKHYPKIKKCTDSWDQKTNIFTYYVS